MTRRAFAMAIIACSMFASVPIIGQGTWIKGPVPVPGAVARTMRVGGVEIRFLGGGFQFDPLPNDVGVYLSPALDQSAVVVFLNGPPKFDPSNARVWILRRDATSAALRTRGSETLKASLEDLVLHYFVFDGPVSEVVGIAVNIDGQLYVRSLTPKPPE